jgi:DNA-binding HxlR family transcriptional regulator
MKLEKITEKPGRTYNDACGTALGLDLIGERWAMLVMRELLLGPRRFGDLRSGLPGISANVLTQRLEGLEAAGVVVKRKLPPPASVQVYELTEWGMEAEPLILGLGKWAARSTLHDPSAPLSAVSLMLSMKTMFVPERAIEEKITVSFKAGDDTYSQAIPE